jgi:hypothetical protein
MRAIKQSDITRRLFFQSFKKKGIAIIANKTNGFCVMKGII